MKNYLIFLIFLLFFSCSSLAWSLGGMFNFGLRMGCPPVIESTNIYWDEIRTTYWSNARTSLWNTARNAKVH